MAEISALFDSSSNTVSKNLCHQTKSIGGYETQQQHSIPMSVVLFTHIVTLFILIVAPAMIKALGLGLWQENHDDDSLVCRSHDALSVAAYPP